MVKDRLTEIINFFDPVKLKDFEDSSYLNDNHSLGNNLLINSAIDPLETSAKFEMAFVFVESTLNGPSNSNSPQKVREELYKLKKVASTVRIADLGNLKTGKNINETLFAVQEVCALLFYLNVNVVLVGGSQLLTVGNFRAFKEFENNINLVSIDAAIDFSGAKEFAEHEYLNKIIREESSHLYNIANVGYQSYFVDSKQIKKLNELFFEQYRLGEVRSKIEEIEPVLRDADLVSFDISSIRMSEAPGQTNGSPNGFYADEVCRLSRYAGISDRVKAFGLYEFMSNLDTNRQTAKLCAQIIWYYIDGYINRKHDFPVASLNDYIKFDVQIDEIDFPIVFYKSNKSGRWWLDVKVPEREGLSEDSILVSCTENDYQRACGNEIPERWWLNFKKLK